MTKLDISQIAQLRGLKVIHVAKGCEFKRHVIKIGSSMSARVTAFKITVV